jgi:hypothetical protein
MSNSTSLNTAVIYDERVIKFLDEFEWYARALKFAREQKQFDPCLPTQHLLGDESSTAVGWTASLLGCAAMEAAEDEVLR